jgi:thioredoxin-dependent peroxiredoxin
LCRHCKSLFGPVARHLALAAFNERSGQVRRILVTIPRRRQICTVADSGTPDKIRNTPMIEPPKATKGRRMSKKLPNKIPQTPAPGTRRADPAAQVKKKARKTPGGMAKTPNNKAAGRAASHTAASKWLKFSDKATGSSAKTAGFEGHTQPALVEGSKAPAFRLPRDGGGTVALPDYPGQKLVVFFYPRADTPGCTREAIDFTRLSGSFADSGTAILGVSADPVKAQEKFRDKHKLSVPLMSDEQHEMLQAYGAWGEKSMYGKTFLGVIRTTVLIGADGRIARIWRHVKVEGHAEAVLEAARGL